MYLYICIIYIYIHVSIRIIYICSIMYRYICECSCTHTYIYTYTYIHIHRHRHIYMFVCMYMLMGYKPVTNSDAHPLTQKPSSETMDWDLPGPPIPQFPSSMCFLRRHPNAWWLHKVDLKHHDPRRLSGTKTRWRFRSVLYVCLFGLFKFIWGDLT